MCFFTSMFAGIAKQLDADATSMVLENCVGTINYMAPECLQGMGSASNVNKVKHRDKQHTGP